MSVTVEGIPSVVALLKALPALANEPFLLAIDEIMEESKIIMKENVEQSIRTVDKTTGALAESITGYYSLNITETGISATLDIGSPLFYAGYAARTISPTVFNRVIFVGSRDGTPRRFRFVETRPRIPGHPFLENSLDDILQLIMEKYSEAFDDVAATIQNQTDLMADVIDIDLSYTPMEAGMRLLFG